MKRSVIRNFSGAVLLLALAAGVLFGGAVRAAAATRPVADGYYSFQAYNRSKGNKVLDIYEDSVENGGNATICRSNMTPNQIFYVKYRKSIGGKAWYTIKAVHSGLVLDVDGARDANGVNCQQWAWHSKSPDSELWAFEKDGTCYRIRSRFGTYITNSGNRTSDGNNVVMWEKEKGGSQKWKLIRRSGAPSLTWNMYHPGVPSGTYYKGDIVSVGGGITCNYPVKKIKVLIYNSSGKVVAKDEAEIGKYINKRNFLFEQPFSTSGWKTGNYWYRVWIVPYGEGKEVWTAKGKYSFKFSNTARKKLEVKGANCPSSLKEGQSFQLTGTVQSNYPLRGVSIVVSTAGGKHKFTRSISPYGTKCVQLKEFNSTSGSFTDGFVDLKAGSYVFQIFGGDRSVNSKLLYSKKFKVTK